VLDLHVLGGFYAAYFGMHQRLSGKDLQAALPRVEPARELDEVARMDALMARAEEFFRAKEQREQRIKNGGLP